MYHIFSDKDLGFLFKYETSARNLSTFKIIKGDEARLEINGIYRVIALTVTEATTLSDLSGLSGITVLSDDPNFKLISLLGKYPLFDDNLVINKTRWYRLTSDIETLSQSLCNTERITENRAGVDISGRGLHIFLVEALNKKSYQDLVKDWFYLEFTNESFYSNIRNIRLSGSIDYSFSGDTKPVLKDDTVDIKVDETKSIASLIIAMEEVFPCLYIPEFEKIPEQGEFIFYRTRQETVSGTIHLSSPANIKAVHYGQYDIQFYYCNQDIRKVLDFRSKFMAGELDLNKMTSYVIPIDNSDSEDYHEIKGVVFWQRDNVSDNSVENRTTADTRIQTSLPTFEFSASVYTPLLIVPKQFVEMIDAFDSPDIKLYQEEEYENVINNLNSDET